VRRRLLALVLVAAGVLAGGRVYAAVLRVVPGVGTPLQDAIMAAAPGDTVRVGEGVYPEVVTIPKAVRLVGVGAERVTVDAGCRFGAAITVSADDATIRGLRVIGGLLNGIEVHGGQRLTVADTVTQGHFPGGCASEEAGIAVAGARRVKLLRNHASGFFVAGIWIAGGGADDGAYRVVGNRLTANAAGVLVQGFGAVVDRVVVGGNEVVGNLQSGVVLDTVARARVVANTVRDNVRDGIRLTRASASLVSRNVVSGHVADVGDDGTTNCWRANLFVTGALPGVNVCAP
jgi:nitrous oxidase accessory protein